jgi:alpha-beta hydrolase superfamily lysophospholipase
MFKFEPTNHFSLGFVKTKDNLQISYRKLKPENPKKNIIIIPGFGSSMTPFLGLQQQFYEKGYCAIIVELRGHGFSDGIGGYVENYSDYCEDIEQIINEITEKNLETILCGHSNGGLASTYYTLNNLNKISSLILLSPWFGLTVPLKWYEIILKKIALSVYPSLSLPIGKRGGDVNVCTQNPVWLKILDIDKQLNKLSSINAVDEVEKAQTYCFGNANKIKQPVILIHGSKDPVTNPNDSKNIFGKFGSNKKKLILPEINVHHPFLEMNIFQGIFEEIILFIENG